MNVTQTTPAGIITVPLPRICDNPYQTRSTYDAAKILAMAASIKALKKELPVTKGLQQVPLGRVVITSRFGDPQILERHWYEAGNIRDAFGVNNTFVQLAFGHSRLRAFMLLCDGLRYTLKHDHIGTKFNGVAEAETLYAELLDPDPDYATMPLILGYAHDQAMWEHAVTENAQRANINPIDEARSIARAIEEFGLTTEQAAKPFGWSRSAAANKKRLLDLPDDVQKQIAAGDLSERHGRELLRVAADPERVRKLAKMAVDKQLPVRRLQDSVDWEEKELHRQQEKDRQFKLAKELLAQGWRTPAGQVVQADRLHNADTDWLAYRFTRESEKDVILIEQNGCGPHCQCFKLTWTTHATEGAYVLDPATPNICLSCTNRDAYRAQCAALGDTGDAIRQAAAERTRKIEALTNEACERWQRWVSVQDKHALWNSLPFWREVMKHSVLGLDRAFRDATDLPMICDHLLNELYRSTREWHSDLSESIPNIDKVNALIKRLAGRVSQETADTE